ncbi:hypothetical protein AB6A40_010581 [Gnathostoma spinigerum]|uniref:Uncharacterized protein n=1 Tax=Gnathostoma spinigerum TaxID=75299 RepID=A0ABD6F2Z8_9BILA
MLARGKGLYQPFLLNSCDALLRYTFSTQLTLFIARITSRRMTELYNFSSGLESSMESELCYRGMCSNTLNISSHRIHTTSSLVQHVETRPSAFSAL